MQTRQPLRTRLALSAPCVAALLAAGGVDDARAAVSLQGLASLPGGGGGASMGYAVSPDGSTVVGFSATDLASESDTGNRAFRWTAAGGMTNLGPVGAAEYSVANAASGDGSVVVGNHAGPGGGPFRWTAAGGMSYLGPLAGGGFATAEALGVSQNGNVIVGSAASTDPELMDTQPFRWTAAGGAVGLGNPYGTVNPRGTARSASADGSVVVGQSLANDTGGAFRWTATGGIVALRDTAVEGAFTDAYDVSADGSVVVGQISLGPNVLAARWTLAGGAVLLGAIPGQPGDTVARGVSADGSVIVGSGGAGSFVWDAAHGMRRFEDVLTGAGIDLTGWSSFELNDVSADGLTFVGTGTHPDGSFEAFVATVPEPASLGLIAVLAAAACAGRRRRHRHPHRAE